MSEILFLSNVRLSFPQLIEPKELVNEKGVKRIVWSADFVLESSSPDFARFMELVNKEAVAKWKEHTPIILRMIGSDRKSRCFGNGNEKIKTSTLLPHTGYAGNNFITAVNNRAPQMIRADGSPADSHNTMEYQALARKLYGGCYVNAAISPWLQDNDKGRAIRCNLVAIQFAKDGEPYGEGVADASAMFKPVAAANLGTNPFGAVAAPVGMPSFLG